VHGTTLILAYDDSGIVMAVDDLGHRKNAQGEAGSAKAGIQKLFVLEACILIGVTGLIDRPRTNQI